MSPAQGAHPGVSQASLLAVAAALEQRAGDRMEDSQPQRML